MAFHLKDFGVNGMPVFTVKEPCFMMGLFDEETHVNEKVLEQFKDCKKQFLNNDADHWVSAYFDGSLMNWLEFDIPIWLSGTWDIHQKTQPCKVWNFAGDECRDAVIVRCKNADFDYNDNRIQFLIVDPSEVTAFEGAVVM